MHKKHDDEHSDHEAYKRARRYSWLNDALLDDMRELQPEWARKYDDMGPGVFISTGEKPHFPWMWE
jgi:hypothetical protein